MSLLKEHSAFPFEGGENNGYSPDGGMSIRAYFAAKAMQGLIAEDSGQENIGRQAVQYADDLIEALNQK